MNRIKNYEELRAHRKYLESNLIVQKNYFNHKVTKIKEGFEPINKVVSFFKADNKTKVHTLVDHGSSLLKIGSNAGIDMLLQKKLAKAGWLTRIFLPFVLRFAAARTLDKVEHKTV
jgi:hypothetical protein